MRHGQSRVVAYVGKYFGIVLCVCISLKVPDHTLLRTGYACLETFVNREICEVLCDLKVANGSGPEAVMGIIPKSLSPEEVQQSFDTVDFAFASLALLLGALSIVYGVHMHVIASF